MSTPDRRAMLDAAIRRRDTAKPGSWMDGHHGAGYWKPVYAGSRSGRED
jgi:hypothetical protein